MKSRLIEFCAGLEEKLDTVLFRTTDAADDEKKRRPVKTAAGAAAASAGAVGGLYAAGTLGKLRVAGNGVIATQPGLSASQGLSKLGQNLGSIGKGGAADIAATVKRGTRVAAQSARRLARRIVR